MPIPLSPIVINKTFDQLAAEGIAIRFDIASGNATATVDFVATNAAGERAPMRVSETVDDLFAAAQVEPALAAAVQAVLTAVARLAAMRDVAGTMSSLAQAF